MRLNGERLAALRNSKGHALSYVARACGVTRQAVEQWERELALPSDRAIDLLGTIFSADELVGVVDVRVWE